jgi:hypothetical protein
MEIQSVGMLTLTCGLGYVGFINLLGVVAGAWRQRLALVAGPI